MMAGEAPNAPNAQAREAIAVHAAEIAGIKADIAELSRVMEKRFDKRDAEISNIHRLIEKVFDRLEQADTPCAVHTQQLADHAKELDRLKSESRVIGVVNGGAAAIAAALGIGGPGRA
jgi:chromosome segregation ATPase